jgi:hypothetical protein
MGDEQIEDRFRLLPAKLIVQGRAGLCLLDRHAGLQVTDRGRGATVVAWPPLALPISDTFSSIRS